jgi:hypothetical protein
MTSDPPKPRRFLDPPAKDDELRAFIEGDSTEEIVRQVSKSFAEELAELVRQAKAKRSS